MSGTAEQEERAKWRANERADHAEELRMADGLTEAWAEAEAALPSGLLAVSRWETNGVYRAVWSADGGKHRESVDAADPVSALRALCVALAEGAKRR